MSLLTGTIVATPYIGAPSCAPQKFCLPLGAGEKPQLIPLDFFWANYGVNQGNPNARVVLDVSGTANVNRFSAVRGVYIDNTGSDGSIYIYFPDTGQGVTCPPFSTAWQPIITNGLALEIIGRGFATNDLSRTKVFLSNVAFPTGITPEVQYTYPQWRASPQLSRGFNTYSNGFASPAIGDQWQTGKLTMNAPSTRSIALWGGPYAQGGTITLTDIYLAYFDANGSLAPDFTATIQSNGASGVFMAWDARIGNAASKPKTEFINKSGMQLKFNAQETWTLDLSWSSNDGGNRLNYLFGYSYQGLSAATAGTFGTNNSADATVRSINNMAGISFVAPATAQITAASWFTVTGGGAGGNSYHYELWTDNAGVPGVQIGADSASAICPSGDDLLRIAFPTPPAIILGTTYWLVLMPDAAAGQNRSFRSVVNTAAYASGRSTTTVAAIAAGTLPNTEDWKVSIAYQTL